MLKFKEKYELMRIVEKIEDISYYIDKLQDEKVFDESDGNYKAIIDAVDYGNLGALWNRLRRFNAELQNVLHKEES